MKPIQKSRGRKPLVALIATVSVGWLIFQVGHRPSEELVIWSNDSELLAGSSDPDRPLTLVEFTRRGCLYCEKMGAEVFTRPEVAEAADGFVRIRLDYDQHPAAVDRFNIKVLPTFAVLDPTGRPITSAQGYLPPDRFIRFLAEAQARWAATGTFSSSLSG